MIEIDKYSNWSQFNPYEYQERNYGNRILKEDREIISNAIREIRELGVSTLSLKRVLDIGVGPNLYPSMIIAPYVANDGSIELRDQVQPNLEYLKKLIDSKEANNWSRFENFMIQEGGERYQGVIQKILNIANVGFGDIYNLSENFYDAGVSFFVIESITDKKEYFYRGLRSFIGSIKPGGGITSGTYG